MQYPSRSKPTCLKSDELEALLSLPRNAIRLDETGNLVVGHERANAQCQGPLKRYIIKQESCWHWNGPIINEHGYGLFILRKKRLRAHRVFYELAYMRNPAKLLVCHTYDNPICVHPNHLFLGTHLDNRIDCEQKGRARAAKGEAAGRAKLTESQVKEILTNYQAKWGEQTRMASLYGVSSKEISHIVARRGWTHVKIDKLIPSAGTKRSRPLQHA